jgi:hypothetical protein
MNTRDADTGATRHPAPSADSASTCLDDGKASRHLDVSGGGDRRAPSSSSAVDVPAGSDTAGSLRCDYAGGVDAELESPIGAYLWWCGHVGTDALDLDALQEWDYLHADDMTATERRTLTAWALASGIFT